MNYSLYYLRSMSATTISARGITVYTLALSSLVLFELLINVVYSVRYKTCELTRTFEHYITFFKKLKSLFIKTVAGKEYGVTCLIAVNIIFYASVVLSCSYKMFIMLLENVHNIVIDVLLLLRFIMSFCLMALMYLFYFLYVLRTTFCINYILC